MQEQNHKINITSGAVEKSLDLVKGFLDKLIAPSIESVGLLIADQANMWRFNNQLKAVLKAKENCEKLGLSTKTISFKLLFPLLEYAGLEDNEKLQDKWGNLLTNMIDSEQNVENHVFPYILSQLSLQEFEVLETAYDQKLERTNALSIVLEDYKLASSEQLTSFNHKLTELSTVELDPQNDNWYEKYEVEANIRSIKYTEMKIIHEMNKAQLLENYNLEDFEVANCNRLGIIKSITQPSAYIKTPKIDFNSRDGYIHLDSIEIDVDTESEDDKLYLTALGEKFIAACKVKKQ